MNKNLNGSFILKTILSRTVGKDLVREFYPHLLEQ